MAEILNGTPHSIKIVDDACNLLKEIAPSGILPRCSATTEVVGEVDGIPLTKTVYGQVENLPEYKEGVFWIVSGLVRAALPDRKDLLSPGSQVRDSEGKIIGCKSLDRNF